MTTETLHGMRERWLDWSQTDMTPLTCAADLQPKLDQLQAVVERMEREGDKFAVEIQTLLGERR